MVELEEYIPSSVMENIKKEIDVKDRKKVVYSAKTMYLKQVKGRYGGKIFLELCAKSFGFPSSDPLNELINNLNLSQIYYIVCNFFTCAKNHYILKAKSYDKEIVKEGMKELISKWGRPIWKRERSEIPELWNLVYEDKEDHYYFSFLHSNPKEVYFDPIVQKFTEYYPTGIINIRVHTDHSFFGEVFYKNTTLSKERKCIRKINDILGIDDFPFLSITNEDLNSFDNTVEQVTHEAREGEEAYTRLTRANREKDTRNDIIRESIEDRPFSNENGIILLNDKKYNVGLTRGDKGEIRFQRHLPPNIQIELTHKIMDIMGWV